MAATGVCFALDIGTECVAYSLNNLLRPATRNLAAAPYIPSQ